MDKGLASWCITEIEKIVGELDDLSETALQPKDNKFHSKYSMTMVKIFVCILLEDEDMFINALRESLKINCDLWGTYMFRESYLNFVKIHGLIGIYNKIKGEPLNDIYEFSLTFAKQGLQNYRIDSGSSDADIVLREFSIGINELSFIKALSLDKISDEKLFNMALRFSGSERYYDIFKRFNFDKVILVPNITAPHSNELDPSLPSNFNSTPSSTDILRDTAVKYEEINDYKSALFFMRKAQEQRPLGPFINLKVEEYKEKLNIT
jgi:hypothetical protein